MARSNSWKNTLLQSLFNSNNEIYLRLHTDALALTDSEVGTEAAFTGYPAGGVLISGTAVNWEIIDNQVKNLLVINFPKCTAGDENIRYFSLWKNNLSTNEIDRYYWGQLSADVNVVTNVTISFQIRSIVITEN